MQTSGASRREIASRIRNYSTVIASAAKQSILSSRGEMDCFVASLLAMTTLKLLWLFEIRIQNSGTKLRVVPDKRSAIRDP